MLLKAIVSFDQQNYPNKEMVISYPSTDHFTKELIQKLQLIADTRFVILERSPEISIGAARNDAVSQANGNYICLWDDDDYHYEMRIKMQYNSLQSNGQFKEASMLSKILLYDSRTGEVYISFPSYWSGSLLCKKELVLKHPFASSDIAEASPLIEFLVHKNYLDQSIDLPQLYVYIYHGTNIHQADQFEAFIANSEQLNAENSDMVRPYIEKQYQLN